jgi:hypothetical protein
MSGTCGTEPNGSNNPNHPCAAGSVCCGGGCANLQTDGMNCGVCGHSCLGGACTGGKCQPVTLATSTGQNTDIAVDATNVYWARYGSPGAVLSCAINNCAATLTTLAGSEIYPASMVVDATNIYWLTGTLSGTNGNVKTCPITGCPGAGPTVLVSGLAIPKLLALNAGKLYWTQAGDGTVRSCTASSCASTLTTLATTSPGVPFGIATDGTNLYWGTGTPNSVSKCSLANCAGTITTLVSGLQYQADRIALSATDIYITSHTSPGDIWKCSLGGCGTSPTTISSPGNAWGVVVDATNVYWTDYANYTVSKCALSGCASPTVMATTTSMGTLAQDATSLYFTSYSTTVYRLAK